MEAVARTTHSQTEEPPPNVLTIEPPRATASPDILPSLRLPGLLGFDENGLPEEPDDRKPVRHGTPSWNGPPPRTQSRFATFWRAAYNT